jgi:hypothetical protein
MRDASAHAGKTRGQPRDRRALHSSVKHQRG